MNSYQYPFIHTKEETYSSRRYCYTLDTMTRIPRIVCDQAPSLGRTSHPPKNNQLWRAWRSHPAVFCHRMLHLEGIRASLSGRISLQMRALLSQITRCLVEECYASEWRIVLPWFDQVARGDCGIGQQVDDISDWRDCEEIKHIRKERIGAGVLHRRR